MNRRLYFLVPDVASARKVLDDLLLARVEERRVQFLANRGVLPEDLPEAGFSQKTDIVHGAQTGFIVGGLVGVVGGALVVLWPPGGFPLQLATILATGLIGAALGAWMASLAGTAVPNSKLRAFHGAIAEGKILVIVDVPFHRVQEISGLIRDQHPEALRCGVEPTVPAFP